MSQNLTEEEMRQALFGQHQAYEPLPGPRAREAMQEVAFTKPTVAQITRKNSASAFTPRLRVTLQVGNEFEGGMYEWVHEADTLSFLLAEQEAVKAARKKYKYVEVVSVKSM